MTFLYIAGFFDGEGCIWKYNNRRSYVTIAQQRPRVLWMIAAFLNSVDIKCSVYRAYDSRPRKYMYQLSITHTASVHMFLKHVRRWLVVKRKSANSALRQTTQWLARQRQRELRYDRAILWYTNGHSVRSAVLTVSGGVNSTTLTKYLKHRGLFRRPIVGRPPSEQRHRTTPAGRRPASRTPTRCQPASPQRGS